MTFSFLIAGFTIKMVLSPTEWPEKRALLIDLIKRYFGPFISFNSVKAHATITICEISGIPFISNNNIQFNQYFVQKKRGLYEVYYHISIFELSQLFLIVLLELLENDGFLLHASGIITERGVVLFSGKSGAGKSTIAKIVCDSFPLFSDDCVAIKKEGGKYYCYQVPWIEKDSLLIHKNTNRVEIANIYFIKKGMNLLVKKIDKLNFLKEMIQNIWTVEIIPKRTIRIVSKFIMMKRKSFILYFSLKSKKKLLRELSQFSL